MTIVEQDVFIKNILKNYRAVLIALFLENKYAQDQRTLNDSETQAIINEIKIAKRIDLDNEWPGYQASFNLMNQYILKCKINKLYRHEKYYDSLSKTEFFFSQLSRSLSLDNHDSSKNVQDYLTELSLHDVEKLIQKIYIFFDKKQKADENDYEKVFIFLSALVMLIILSLYFFMAFQLTHLFVIQMMFSTLPIVTICIVHIGFYLSRSFRDHYHHELSSNFNLELSEPMLSCDQKKSIQEKFSLFQNDLESYSLTLIPQ